MTGTVKSKSLFLAASVFITSPIISRADQTITVQSGFNYFTCQVAGGPVNTILTNVPPWASDPYGLTNWTLSIWNVTNQIFKIVAYFTADDLYSICGLCGIQGDGWYDQTGVKVTWGLTEGQGFVLFVPSAIAPTTIPVVGSPVATPLYTYSPTQFNFVGSPITLPDSPPATYTNVVNPPAVNGEAFYAYKNPLRSMFSPLYMTMNYFDSDQGGWVPSEPSISPANRPSFVGPSPQIVKGTVFKDPAGNFSTSSGALPNWTVRLTATNGANLYGVTDQNGKYAIIIPPGAPFSSGTLTVSPAGKNGWTQSADGLHPAVYAPPHAFSGQFSFTNDFWEQPPTSGGPHLSLDLVSTFTSPRISPCCGQPMTYVVTYLNDGTADLSGITLTLTLPGAVTFAPGQGTSTPNVGPASVSGNDLTWTISPTIGGSGVIYVPVTVNSCGGPQPPLAAAVSAMGVTANSAAVGQAITCALGYNDMQVSPAGCGLISVEQELTYRIDFQNTSLYPVYQVVVSNTLPAGLDPSSVAVIASSHHYAFQTNGSQLVWTFPGIYLPQASVNEPGSHGYVKYKVKPLVGTSPGTAFANQAWIYLDANSPALTITVNSTVATNPVPVAAFIVSPEAGSSGFTNDFTYTGGTTGATFSWNFGPDATPTTSSDQNPSSVVFASAGNHIVTLQVTLGGCTSDPAVGVVHAGLPALSATFSNGQLGLSWQGNGFHLQETDSLNPAQWTATSAIPTHSGSSFFVAIPLSGAKYYRLSQVAP